MRGSQVLDSCGYPAHFMRYRIWRPNFFFSRIYYTLYKLTLLPIVTRSSDLAPSIDSSCSGFSTKSDIL